MDTSYHYPPELLQLLIDTIPRLCRSKRDVLIFFRGAGIGGTTISGLDKQLRDDSNSINKFDMVRRVLTHLNEAGDATLRARREVLKRVVEFEDFSTCWPADRLVAQGLVSQVRRVINVKDSFTKMRQAREAEVSKNLETKRREAESLMQRRKNLAAIHTDFNRLFSIENAQERGRLLEGVLNRLFRESGILVRDAFSRVSEPGHGVAEQIDGVVEIAGEIYLVEMKWLKDPVGVSEVSQHLVRVFNRSASRGIFISYSGYTAQAIDVCRESLSKAVVVLGTLQEFVILLESDMGLEDFLKAKIQGSIIDKRPYTNVLSNRH